MYLALYQVCSWIRDRDPAVLTGLHDRVIPDDDLKALENLVPGKAVAKSTFDALFHLRVALDSGRIKAKGRLKWVGNLRSISAGRWPDLIFANRNRRGVFNGI